MRNRGGDPRIEVAELATLVQRLAVLLAAGVAPRSAWSHAGTGTALEDAARRVGAADPSRTAEAIAGIGMDAITLRGLAMTWAVAVEAGAPLAGSLRAYAALLRAFAEAERQARIALSGPRATSRLVLAMPAVGLLFGAALGQDVLGVLFGGPLGWGCLIVGLGLLLAALAWNRRLLAGARVGEELPGLVAELAATAMSGGASAERAAQIVLAAADRFDAAASLAPIESAMRVASAAGAPVAELLRADAEEARRDAAALAAERAERLSVTLLLPLGVCVLPAFVALGVVPMIAGIVSSTVTLG